MAGLAELTQAIAAQTEATNSLTTAVDKAVAAGIGQGTPPPDLQGAVDSINANTAATAAATAKLVSATPTT